MNYEELKNTLAVVCNTLNGVSVEGMENMNRMLGAYSTLQQVIEKISNEGIHDLSAEQKS